MNWIKTYPRYPLWDRAAAVKAAGLPRLDIDTRRAWAITYEWDQRGRPARFTPRAQTAIKAAPQVARTTQAAHIERLQRESDQRRAREIVQLRAELKKLDEPTATPPVGMQQVRVARDYSRATQHPSGTAYRRVALGLRNGKLMIGPQSAAMGAAPFVAVIRRVDDHRGYCTLTSEDGSTYRVARSDIPDSAS